MRIAVAMILVLAACAGGEATAPPESPVEAGATTTTGAILQQGCADVVGVDIEETAGTFTFHVTVASADEGWDKYADEWTVRTLDGTVLGTRQLLHPHENEQPFTRSLSGVEVPREVTAVVVAARDSVEGYCGATVEVAVR